MSSIEEARRRWLQPVLWVARWSGVAVALLVLFFFVTEFGGGTEGPPGIPVTLLLGGIFAGYVIGWRWPLVGGALGLACAIAFYGGRLLVGSRFLAVQMMLFLPGVLFVLHGLGVLRKAGRRKPGGGQRGGGRGSRRSGELGQRHRTVAS